MRAVEEHFGETPAGEAVALYRLETRSGLRATLISHGASLLALELPDRCGRRVPVVLGCADLAGHVAQQASLGACVGRFANRIAHGRLLLGGRLWQLDRNEGPHHLHGGRGGLGRVVWRGEAIDGGVAFRYSSPDGDQGYPGRLDVRVEYRLGEDGGLRIDFHARASARSVVNLSHHAYFNLRDGGASDVRDHRLWIDADAVLPVDATRIPTGELAPVAGGAWDFRRERLIAPAVADGSAVRASYDHCFVLRGGRTASPRLVARLCDPQSGRRLEVSTTQPGLQLYTGQGLDGSIRGAGGLRYGPCSGLCLETQHFPDSPSRPHFPSTEIGPGEPYHETVVYRFAGA